MSEVNVAPAPAAQEPVAQPATPDINAQLGNSLWNENFVAPQPAAPDITPAPAAQPAAAPVKPEPKIVDVNEWLKETYGWESVDAGKAELDRLNKLAQQAQTPAEIKYANEEARKYHEAIIAGKSDDLYNILHKQRELTRLEQLEINTNTEAAQIIKANLQFKNPFLKPDEIDFLVQENYRIPEKPIRVLEDTDETYNAAVSEWQQQVDRVNKKMVIDAKLAKPELVKYKSELSLPDIPKVDPQPQGPSQEDLAKAEAFRNNFNQHLERDYNKFTGFAVTAKDGGVDLPITYGVTPEELTASKQELQTFNVNEFLDNRWFDKEGNPNVTLMQKDLYVLRNLDKILQKVANEASAQRAAHELKVRNNINLNSVTPGNPQPAGTETKTEQQQLAEKVWAIN